MFHLKPWNKLGWRASAALPPKQAARIVAGFPWKVINHFFFVILVYVALFPFLPVKRSAVTFYPCASATCSDCGFRCGVAQEHRLCGPNVSFVGLWALCFESMWENGWLCKKPLPAKQSDKVTPENKAVFGRYGDQRGHPWPPVSYFTHHLFFDFPFICWSESCTASPQSTTLCPPFLSGILFIHRWLFA